MAELTVFVHKDITKQVQKLWQMGGNFQRAADKVKTFLWDIKHTNDVQEVINKLNTTHHGEDRIKHCIKYDFSGFCRLVTIRDNGWFIVVFFGTHDETDKWLEKNKGYKAAVTDPKKGLFDLYMSEDISEPEKRISPESDFSGGLLFQKLKQYWTDISKTIPPFLKKTFEKFDTITDEDEILEVASAISEKEKQELFFDVFMSLRGGLVDEAKRRILSYFEDITLLENLKLDEVKNVRSNDEYLNIDDIDADDMKILMSNKNWLEWMLFMHPAQKQVVDRDFKGSARLLGVSGSGKTCVVVRRAVRLAKKYPNKKILILTLNQSLSQLIKTLVDKMLQCSNDENLKEFIEVKSFWQLCQGLIIQLRNGEFDKRVLGPKTDKLNETIDEIWDEFYLCKNNNNDADVLFPVHCSLLSRGINSEEYIRQEFDWIRSFLPKETRNEYLEIDREGRTIPMVESEREIILKGLLSWEQKMKFVGVIDYLGLANELYKYINELVPIYRCVLVDEIQDFGTLELSLIRKLVKEEENDLFLTGDIAQQVYCKHNKIKNAGIQILPDSYLKILKNYRNSREILGAAYAVFKSNVSDENFQTDDFEILNPEFANFSSPRPYLRKAKDLDLEFASAFEYLNSILSEKEKGCIAISGYSSFEVDEIGTQANLTVLNGNTEIGSEKIYLSDLEQTKGFEFDRMIIINVNNGVIPNPILPEAEWFRDISKLYVAMTRAKKELIISYSQSIPNIFNNCLEYFNEDTWDTHVGEIVASISIPKVDQINFPKSQAIKMLGKDFLYHKRAIGISRELQSKLIELVNGKSVTSKGKKVGWINMDELKKDVLTSRDLPNLSRLFGSVVIKELQEILKNE